jgi:phosphohistidine phosphatase
MPKHLYLLRHAASVEKHQHQHDKERELSQSGIQEAIQIGSFLSKSGIQFDRVISSSAARTTTTTQLITDAIRLSLEKVFYEDDLYTASVRTFFDDVCRLDDSLGHVMYVGHNPAISYLAEYLTKADISDMATCGLAMIKFNIQSWKDVSQGNGSLENYVYPAMLMTS